MLPSADATLEGSRASPFRGKGLAYRGIVRDLSTRVGWDRVLEACPDPQLRAFLSQPFLAASWYDIYPIVDLCEISAALLGQDYATFLKEQASRQAREDLKGVYRAILRVISPELALRGLVKITSRYYDFGVARIVEQHDGSALAERTLVPKMLFEWYGTVSAAYIDEVLRAAGAGTVKVLWKEGRTSVDRGHPVATMVIEIAWTRSS